MYCIRRRLTNVSQGFRPRLISVKVNKIIEQVTPINTLSPPCYSCSHYNPKDATCRADKFSPPVVSAYYRTNDLQTNCGPEGKYYNYYGPELAKDNKKLLRNFGLSSISLGVSTYLFSVYPPYSMVICTIPLSLTAVYGMLLIEQTYIYNKMEKEQQKQQIKTNK